MTDEGMAFFVKTLESDSWRETCGSNTEANSLFLHLFATGAINVAVCVLRNNSRALCLIPGLEKAAAIENGDVDVLVRCRFSLIT